LLAFFQKRHCRFWKINTSTEEYQMQRIGFLLKVKQDMLEE